MYGLISRDAEIFDGTGAASIGGGIAVEGDRIAAVGTVTGTRAWGLVANRSPASQPPE